MNLDIRLPLGLVFTIVGAILTGYGIATRNSGMYRVSEGVNINLLWGLLILLFGVGMLGLAVRRRKRRILRSEFVSDN